MATGSVMDAGLAHRGGNLVPHQQMWWAGAEAESIVFPGVAEDTVSYFQSESHSLTTRRFVVHHPIRDKDEGWVKLPAWTLSSTILTPGVKVLLQG